MKVIPVIDIQNNNAVHAIRGRRHEYKPLQSILCNTSDPFEIAKFLKQKGFSELYIADLDAITKRKTNYQIIKNITEATELKLMVDAGVSDIKKAERLLDVGVSKVIIGTETLKNRNFLSEAISQFGSERIILSLDLKDGKVLGKNDMASMNPIVLLQEFKDRGVCEVIVLDLARVGSREGINTDLVKKILANVPVNVFVGGGVRNIDDLLKLKEMGVSGVLLATALHEGKISAEELKQAKLL